MTGLTVNRREKPLIVSFPHTGILIPDDIEADLIDPRRARRDADWWIDRLYDFVHAMGATTIHTTISRTVIDVNRDPSGVSLYPGQATTELVPTTTFDGEPLWRRTPDDREVARRHACYFNPYHAALKAEIQRLRSRHPRVVVYDCHSIRSVIPRLFDGALPVFNIGTNDRTSCDLDLQRAIEEIVRGSGEAYVTNGRFKGGYITRHHANPSAGVHCVQMELACRGYMREPVEGFCDEVWPTPYDPAFAAPMRETLTRVLRACLAFAEGHTT